MKNIQDNEYVDWESRKTKEYKGANWFFTINNYTQKDIDWLEVISQDVKRIRVSKELGEKCKTPHLQGCIVFAGNQRFASVKKKHSTAYWAKINQVDNAFLYCCKCNETDEMIIDVDNRHQGKSSKDIEVVEAIKNGASINSLWKDYPLEMVRRSKGFSLLHQKLNTPVFKSMYKLDQFKWEPIKNWERSIILHGEAGIGKTEFAKAHFNNPCIVTHMDDLKNFDKEIHDGIIFDDMDFTRETRSTQINLLDMDLQRSINIRYDIATIPAQTKKIFTCNTEVFPPFEIEHSDMNEDYAITTRYMEYKVSGTRLRAKLMIDPAVPASRDSGREVSKVILGSETSPIKFTGNIVKIKKKKKGYEHLQEE